MLEKIPSLPSTETFGFTLFPNRYVTGSGGSVFPGPGIWVEGWDEYCDLNKGFAQTAVMAKADAPGIIHGVSNGWHSNSDVQSCTALVIDCDKSLLAESDIEAFLSPMAGLRFFFQWRAGKFHIVFPLAVTIRGLDADLVTKRRKTAIEWLARLWGRQLDRTTAAAGALLHPYCRKTEDAEVPLTIYNSADGLFDLDSVLADVDYQEVINRRIKEKTVGTTKQQQTWCEAVSSALDKRGWLGKKFKDKWAICCPFHPETHDNDGNTSTILWLSGRIHCSHDRCLGRLPVEYYRKLNLEMDGNYSAEVRLLLAPSVERVSVEEAETRIKSVLAETKPYERNASIVRVTTGAGKTRAAAAFLDNYCAPTFDSETGDVIPGRSAFFAVPTNALLREVRERLTVEHKVSTGVLAVLNDDGSSACIKHDTAKRLQAAGGDVHRLMCAGCEVRESCPARAKASFGGGSLVLTNHSLLPSLVRTAADEGRIPLIVWDETPALTETGRLKHSDLDWMLTRFEMEDSPRRIVTLGRLMEPDLYGERARIAMRPLVEILRRFRASMKLDQAVEEFGSTRLAESMLSRAESFLKLPPVVGVLERALACASGSKRVNVSEMMFDQMSEAHQELVLRAESINKTLSMLYSGTYSLTSQPGAIEISKLTENGLLWRDFGGVVFDATAPIHDLKGLRADARLIDVSVEDDDPSGVIRLMICTAGLSKRRLADSKDVLELVSTNVQRNLTLLQKRLGRPPKVLLVTYKVLISEIRNRIGDLVEYWNYGNTRGYDGWFQRGFDAVVTVGDPYTNLGAESHAYDLLSPRVDFETYCAYRAQSELSQAHGRLRTVQKKKGSGIRAHFHYGRLPPLDWGGDTLVEGL